MCCWIPHISLRLYLSSLVQPRVIKIGEPSMRLVLALSQKIIKRKRIGDIPKMFFVSILFDWRKEYLEQVEWYQSVYSPPGEWTFISDGADERYVSCRKPENVESTHCVWIARYGQIVVEFRGWIAPGYNTLEEMEVLVQAVDEKAVEYIPRDRDY